MATEKKKNTNEADELETIDMVLGACSRVLNILDVALDNTDDQKTITSNENQTQIKPLLPDDKKKTGKQTKKESTPKKNVSQGR